MKRLKLAWERMAYQGDGGFSLTRLIMFFSAIPAVLLIPIGIVCGVYKITIPDNVYDYSFKMAGLGASQYLATKIKQGASEYISSKTNITVQDSSVAKEE